MWVGGGMGDTGPAHQRRPPVYKRCPVWPPVCLANRASPPPAAPSPSLLLLFLLVLGGFSEHIVQFIVSWDPLAG